MEYDDYEWTYDFETYLKDLAENLVSLLNENILDDVIVCVSSDMKVHRPKFYNFITDHIYLDFEVNETALNEYIEKHKEKYERNKITSRDGFSWHGEENETRLNYYLNTVSSALYSEGDYLNDQFETVDAYEYIDYKRNDDKNE